MAHHHHLHGQGQKLSDNLTGSLSVKMDDHVHFKPDIHLLSSKSHQYANVNSVLPNHTPGRHQHQSSFNPPSLFSNTIRNPDGLAHGLGMDDGSTSNGIYGSGHDTTNLSSNYRSGCGSHQHALPPQIFSASLSTNLLSSTEHQHSGFSSHQYDKSNDHGQTHTGLRSQATSYNSSLAMGGSLRIGSTGSTHSVQSSASNQFSQSDLAYSHSNLHYSQSNASLHYSHTSSEIADQQSHAKHSSNQNGMAYSQQGSVTAYQSGTSLLDGHQSSNGQQPTYVLLQAPGDNESGPTQVYLAMSNPDPQQSPYITLQHVNVDGTELTASLVQDDVNLPVLNGDLSATDKQLSNSEGAQVVLSLPHGQNSLISSSANSNSLVTYLQPLQSIGVSSMEQSQVIMASSDLQGNLTLHNVGGISTSNKGRILSSGRQSSQVGLSTPRRRLSQDPRSCDQCGRSFKYPSDLKKHLQIHTDIKKFACDDCPRSFRRLHQLNVHRRIHTGEKPYVCNRCGAQFRHDSTLTMHIRTRHDHLKPFTCEGCSKKFGRMSHLRKHQRNVCGRGGSRSSNAQCKYCEATFPKKSDLKSHFMECDKKPDRVDKDLLSPTAYLCETCGKQFTRVYDYKRHQLSHSDEKPYGCPQCGKMFKERSSLNKHVKRMHCADGDGTIPIDDDSIIPDDEDDDDDMSGDEDDHTVVTLSVGDGDVLSTSNVTAQALAQAGIIASSDGVLTANGHTISATEILNFPEVAEALGINSGSHATVLDSDGNSTMIAITQSGNLETSEVSMDMEQNIIHDGSVIVSEESDVDHYISSTEPLSITSVSVNNDAMEPNDELHVYNHNSHETTMYSHTSSDVYDTSLGNNIVFKQEDEPQFLKDEEELADHVKAEQAADHDLSPEEQHDEILNPEESLDSV